METVLATIKLSRPIKIGEQVTNEIVFKRRPKAKDWRGIPEDEVTHDHNQMIISRLSNTPINIIEELDVVDYREVLNVLKLFLVDGPKTGETLLAT
jgi:Phage tail assembly chaperone proteins, E, or 41 or 14